MTADRADELGELTVVRTLVTDCVTCVTADRADELSELTVVRTLLTDCVTCVTADRADELGELTVVRTLVTDLLRFVNDEVREQQNWRKTLDIYSRLDKRPIEHSTHPVLVELRVCHSSVVILRFLWTLIP